MSSLPSGWVKKESSRHPGKMYYFNEQTGESTWDPPTVAAAVQADQVQAFHILRKHSGSRRPASWRNPNITQSLAEAQREVSAYLAQLREVEATQGFDAMFKLFKQIAEQNSDCGSHERGGDLGVFGRGQMQRPFEEATFGLQPGQLSGLVETDSGVHIILRVR
eukprot:gene38778-47154_t